MEFSFHIIFGATRLILGLLLVFKVIQWNSTEGRQASSIWMKTIAIVCVGSGIYTLVFSNSSDCSLFNKHWNDNDKALLIGKCLQESGEIAKKHPVIMRTFCDCSIEAEMKRFSKSEYLELIKKPISERAKIELPVFKNCFDQMQKDIQNAR